MVIDYTGSTAIVTGSTKGIGFAVAKGLANAGAEVVVNGRSTAQVDLAVSKLTNAGGKARGVVADLATPEGCATLIDAVPRADILINNAFTVGFGSLFELTDEVWNASWQANVMSAVRLSRHYLPGMKGRDWGRLVFISSESARNVPVDLLPYAVSKLGLHALSRGIAKSVSGSGITSNVIVVGPTMSDGFREMLQPTIDGGVSEEEAGRSFVMAARPSSIIQRTASVEEVAAMILYVCSRQASATTGAALRVDGGVVDDVN